MVADAFDIPIYAEEHEQATLENPTLNLSGMIGKQEVYHADIYVKDGETLELAGFSLKVFLTPGHTKGGCCYYIEKSRAVFTEIHCSGSLSEGQIFHREVHQNYSALSRKN